MTKSVFKFDTVSVNDVLYIINDLPSNKATRLDNIPARLIMCPWNITKSDKYV